MNNPALAHTIIARWFSAADPGANSRDRNATDDSSADTGSPSDPSSRGFERCGMARRISVLAMVAVAAGLLVASLELPLWQMRMEAPQYQAEEALNVVIYPDAMRGDLTEIKVLNQYIGVHIPEHLPQLTWLPLVLINGAVLGVIAGFLPASARRRLLVGIPIAVGVMLLAAAGQAQKQMYDVGHRRDAKTAMVGVKDFTPPLLGSVKLAQFRITSSLGFGAYLIGAAVALQFGAAWLSRRIIVESGGNTSGEAPCTPKRVNGNARDLMRTTPRSAVFRFE